MNAGGCHIFMKPVDERRFLLLDDIPQLGRARLFSERLAVVRIVEQRAHRGIDMRAPRQNLFQGGARKQSAFVVGKRVHFTEVESLFDDLKAQSLLGPKLNQVVAFFV